nr:hypothetical protein BACY1_17440 [Tenacibaculum mesophilum]
MKKNFIISIFLLISLSLFAQKELKGVIKDNNNLEIFGANVYWLNTNTGTTTNETGTFSIPYKKEYKKLIISFVGYKTDTINVSSTKPINHYLTESNTLNEVAVSAKKVQLNVHIYKHKTW